MKSQLIIDQNIMKKTTTILTTALLLLTLSMSNVNAFKTSMELPDIETVDNESFDDNGTGAPKIARRGKWVPLKSCRYSIFKKVCNIYNYRR